MLSPHELSALMRVRVTGLPIRVLDDDLLALRHYRLVEMVDDGARSGTLRLTGLGETVLKRLGVVDAEPGNEA